MKKYLSIALTIILLSACSKQYPSAYPATAKLSTRVYYSPSGVLVPQAVCDYVLPGDSATMTYNGNTYTTGITFPYGPIDTTAKIVSAHDIHGVNLTW